MIVRADFALAATKSARTIYLSYPPSDRSLLIDSYFPLPLRLPAHTLQLLPFRYRGVFTRTGNIGSRSPCVDLYILLTEMTDDHCEHPCETPKGCHYNGNYAITKRMHSLAELESSIRIAL